MNPAKIMIAGGVAMAVGLSLASGAQVWRNRQAARQWAEEQAVADRLVAERESAAQAQLAAQVAQLSAGIQKVHAGVKETSPGFRREREDLLKLEDAAEEWASRPAAAVPEVLTAEQSAALPKKFQDELVYPKCDKDYVVSRGGGELARRHHSYEGHRAPFTMVLVPGDAAKGVAPFYIGETEVTWDLFRPWAEWEDRSPEECNEETMKKLRPSNQASYSDNSHMAGYESTPAMGMSRLTAEKFCELLSSRTGRRYRLPTEAEWGRAYALGGGDPPNQAGKLAAAWCKENSDDFDRSDVPENLRVYGPRVGKVATKKPNALGLYDMLGNVAEWVQTPGGPDRNGKNTFVRGGDFLTPAAQLTGARREESDNHYGGDSEDAAHNSWNATYPNNPPSIWWYKDHYQVGFRLVCDPVNLPPR